MKLKKTQSLISEGGHVSISLGIILLALVATTSFAEVIHFKSGETVEGKVTLMTAEEVKIDTGIGVETTYFRDEIEKIDDRSVGSAEGIEVNKENLDAILTMYANAKSGKEQYYDTGELKSVGSLKNGLYRSYYKDGKLEEEMDGDFRNWKPYNGRHTRYFEDGTIQFEQTFKDGVFLDDNGQPYNGTFKHYYENGNVIEELPYQNGLVDGTFKNYYENGVLGREIEYKMGLIHGFMTVYDEEGNITARVQYKDNKSFIEKENSEDE